MSDNKEPSYGEIINSNKKAVKEAEEILLKAISLDRRVSIANDISARMRDQLLAAEQRFVLAHAIMKNRSDDLEAMQEFGIAANYYLTILKDSEIMRKYKEELSKLDKTEVVSGGGTVLPMFPGKE
jgi:hypothetical protein